MGEEEGVEEITDNPAAPPPLKKRKLIEEKDDDDNHVITKKKKKKDDKDRTPTPPPPYHPRNTVGGVGKTKGYCWYPYCWNKRSSCYLTFFQFPKDAQRRAEWCKIMEIEEAEVKKSSVICEKHFQFKDFCNEKKCRLKDTAVPKKVPTGVPPPPPPPGLMGKNSNKQSIAPAPPGGRPPVILPPLTIVVCRGRGVDGKDLIQFTTPTTSTQTATTTASVQKNVEGGGGEDPLKDKEKDEPAVGTPPTITIPRGDNDDDKNKDKEGQGSSLGKGGLDKDTKINPLHADENLVPYPSSTNDSQANNYNSGSDAGDLDEDIEDDVKKGCGNTGKDNKEQREKKTDEEEEEEELLDIFDGPIIMPDSLKKKGKYGNKTKKKFVGLATPTFPLTSPPAAATPTTGNNDDDMSIVFEDGDKLNKNPSTSTSVTEPTLPHPTQTTTPTTSTSVPVSPQQSNLPKQILIAPKCLYQLPGNPGILYVPPGMNKLPISRIPSRGRLLPEPPPSPNSYRKEKKERNLQLRKFQARALRANRRVEVTRTLLQDSEELNSKLEKQVKRLTATVKLLKRENKRFKKIKDQQKNRKVKSRGIQVKVRKTGYLKDRGTQVGDPDVGGYNSFY